MKGGSRGRDPVVIYTDGACLGNPGPAASAAHLFYKDKEKITSRYLGYATNNIAELEAIKLALELMKRRDVPVDIYCDSTYAIGVLSKGWKAKANQSLIAQIKALMAEFKDIRLLKVNAHTGVPPNELVDKLAKEAIRTKQGIVMERRTSQG